MISTCLKYHRAFGTEETFLRDILEILKSFGNVPWLTLPYHNIAYLILYATMLLLTRRRTYDLLSIYWDGILLFLWLQLYCLCRYQIFFYSLTCTSLSWGRVKKKLVSELI